MVFKVEVRQEPPFLTTWDLNHAIYTEQQHKFSVQQLTQMPLKLSTMTDQPTHQSLLKSENLGRQSFSLLLHCFQSIRANQNNGAASHFPQSVSELSFPLAASFTADVSKTIVHSLNLIQQKPPDTDDQSQ